MPYRKQFKEASKLTPQSIIRMPFQIAAYTDMPKTMLGKLFRKIVGG